MSSILITGGSKGIGQGLVKEYLHKGFTVYNLDKEISSIKNKRLSSIVCDLSDFKQVKKVFANLPTIDLLICNAATFDRSLFLEQEIEELIHITNVNLMSHILLAQLYAKQFHQKHGRIVFLSSTRSYMSEENTVGYSVSKGGINALTHSLAITLQDKNITVNAIAPGWINSHSDNLKRVDHEFHPSKRVGRIEDIVRACLFLTDQDSDFINGEVIRIDGGVSKKMIYPEENID